MKSPVIKLKVWHNLNFSQQLTVVYTVKILRDTSIRKKMFNILQIKKVKKYNSPSELNSLSSLNAQRNAGASVNIHLCKNIEIYPLSSFLGVLRLN